MKNILIVDYEMNEIRKMEYVRLKKNKTIIKNLKLINNLEFIEKEKGNYKFFIEEWESFDGNVINIVCGLHGGKLKPIHISSEINNRKALFHTEFNVTININIKKNIIKIYENRIEGNKIIGNLLQSLTIDNIFNSTITTEHYDNIIRDVIKKTSEDNFIYNKPLYSL
jgi:hypothetical protein